VFLAKYVEMYLARSRCKPTIGEAEGKIVKDLLSAHGLAICLAKLDSAFTGKHWWVKDGEPVTLRSIRANVDGLAVSAGAGRAETPSEARAARLMINGAWANTANLAAIEAGLRADGVEIPWRDHPARVAMEAEGRDGCGMPLRGAA
jgi:hypothetical protein